jgi:hypothetical protein
MNHLKTSKEANNNPGLCPIEGQEASTCIMNLKYAFINVTYLDYNMAQKPRDTPRLFK